MELFSYILMLVLLIFYSVFFNVKFIGVNIGIPGRIGWIGLFHFSLKFSLIIYNSHSY